MSRYSKLFAALGGVLSILASALTDGLLTSSEVESVILAAVSAFFVWRLPNKPPAEPASTLSIIQNLK